MGVVPAELRWPRAGGWRVWRLEGGLRLSGMGMNPPERYH